MLERGATIREDPKVSEVLFINNCLKAVLYCNEFTFKDGGKVGVHNINRSKFQIKYLNYFCMLQKLNKFCVEDEKERNQFLQRHYELSRNLRALRGETDTRRKTRQHICHTCYFGNRVLPSTPDINILKNLWPTSGVANL
ncbi:hypothetical protein TNIN_77391 [Trichonephila inaurata madagascariensis]|uniref:Uncharacterized protein n=1 Tax=Trichonephila inaurata madagascariensis TaxID=2747483 RepID=A0A8X7BY65_9ARAC|nr:hypothetical protein TNIN_77391 [Trichonephila inaurata madagascariensis]